MKNSNVFSCRPRQVMLIVMLVCTILGWETGSEAHEHEIVVYGGSAGGIVAGIQAKRMGKSVVVIEPTRRIGGLTTGGLGQTDIGNKRAIGGLSRDFYKAVRQHYQAPQAWKWQSREAYRSGRAWRWRFSKRGSPSTVWRSSAASDSIASRVS
jgi:choline dehydrogenase-like flavoprotein